MVYQLRLVLRGVSPLIWRRLLVRSDSTIADLHDTLQRALGWSDEHLNRFVLRGREYGVRHDGGVGFVQQFRPLSGLELQGVIEHQWVQLGLDTALYEQADTAVVNAIARVTGGNFRLVHSLFAQTAPGYRARPRPIREVSLR